MDKPLSLSLWIMIIFAGYVMAVEDERTIKERILKDYDKSLPPILYSRGNHYTFVSLSVLRIRGLDESKGELIVEGPIALVWIDERISWISDEVDKLRFSSDEVWVPRLKILNRVEEDELTVDSLPIAFPTVVWWIPRYVLRTTCIPNLKHYPFDKQTCEILIVSLTDEGDLLQTNYTAPEISLSHSVYVTSKYMVNNSHWQLLSADVSMKRMLVDIDTNNDVGIFTFELERSMPMIALAILTPSVVSMILLLTTFWMRAGTSVRTGLCATSIIVCAGSLFCIGRILPVTGLNTPIIVEYVAISLILSTISALQSMAMSAVSRCRIHPPIPYALIAEKLPRWTLVLLALSPQEDEGQILDETFLFSELSDNDGRFPVDQSSSTRENTIAKTKFVNLWEKHILLLDRLTFYLMGTVIFLLLVSISFTE